MEAPVHDSVLAEEVLRRLTPVDSGLVVDCTLGLGGHALRILDVCGSEVRLIGMDVDEQALRHSRGVLEKYRSRVRLVCSNFVQIADVLTEFGEASAEVILADLGFSSWQLDRAELGLSFQLDGPLDMRLSPEAGTRTAADILARCTEVELAALLWDYGEERLARRIAKRIVAIRRRERIQTTSQLARLVISVLPAAMHKRHWRIHPATRVFQALRIAVNRELENLEDFLEVAPPLLAVGGRLAVISFHSLEDRRVKHAFRRWSRDGLYEVLTPKPICADLDERRRNPRSRSAKLRVLQRA